MQSFFTSTCAAFVITMASYAPAFADGCEKHKDICALLDKLVVAEDAERVTLMNEYHMKLETLSAEDRKMMEEERATKTLKKKASETDDWDTKWEAMDKAEKLEYITNQRKKAEKQRWHNWNQMTDDEKILGFENSRKSMQEKLKAMGK